MHKTKKVHLILCALLVLCMCLAGCKAAPPAEEANPQLYVPLITRGKGDTAFALNVVTADGIETRFNILTNQKTVGDALQEVNLISGEPGPYGLYVKTVNGVTYDFDKDGKYWAFYVNDTYATAGVDKTEIEDGCTYSFKAE